MWAEIVNANCSRASIRTSLVSSMRLALLSQPHRSLLSRVQVRAEDIRRRVMADDIEIVLASDSITQIDGRRGSSDSRRSDSGTAPGRARPMSGPILVQHDTTEFSTGVRRSRKPSTRLRSRYDLLDGPSKRGIVHSRPHPQHRIVNEGGPDGEGDRGETVASRASTGIAWSRCGAPMLPGWTERLNPTSA
jgi:hypothetical protein